MLTGLAVPKSTILAFKSAETTTFYNLISLCIIFF